jgi:hypothetical protein
LTAINATISILKEVVRTVFFKQYYPKLENFWLVLAFSSALLHSDLREMALMMHVLKPIFFSRVTVELLVCLMFSVENNQNWQLRLSSQNRCYNLFK